MANPASIAPEERPLNQVVRATPRFRFDPMLELCDQPVQRGISIWKNQELQVKYTRKEPLQSVCMTHVIRNLLILKTKYLAICVILAYKQM
jgi:hypothetical protein